MASSSLSIGMTTTIQQNRSYALPAKMVVVTSNLAVQTSMDEVGWNALPNAETTGAQTGASFIRCAVGNAVVICKEAGKDQSGFSSQYISFGSAPSNSGEIRMSAPGAIKYRASNQDWDLISTDGSGSVRVGNTNFGLYLQGTPVINAPIMLIEGAEPGNATNIAQVFCKDNGSGKTQLMVKFGSGAAIQIAIEP